MSFSDTTQEINGTLTLEQRVEIAQDVLKLLKVYDDKKLNIKQMTYFCTRRNLPTQCQLTSKIATDSECVVCARGALFLASVDRYDKCELSKYNTFNVTDRTRDEWGNKQIDLIEAAFEEWYRNGPEAFLFGQKYKTTRNRLKAICNNIIRNKGVFIP